MDWICVQKGAYRNIMSVVEEEVDYQRPERQREIYHNNPCLRVGQT